MDMIYYVKQMPKMKRMRDVDYNVDQSKGAIEYLFEDEGMDGSFVQRPNYETEEDNQIEDFSNDLAKTWGRAESQLRTAIYVSFVKDTDTHLFRKKIKQQRKSIKR